MAFIPAKELWVTPWGYQEGEHPNGIKFYRHDVVDELRGDVRARDLEIADLKRKLAEGSSRYAT